MGGLWHLTKRFFGAVRPGAPPADAERWARDQLTSGEIAIWEQMNNPDRRHAIDVARAVAADPRIDLEELGSSARPVMAAALLHDSGKVICGFRTPARVAATVVWAVASDATADRWLASTEGGPRKRLAQYRRHPELGAEMLERAGSDRLTVSWAEEHHRPESRWTVPVEVGRVLKDCDDD